MKTVAIIESLDTKLDESLFAAECINKQGLNTLLIDNSTWNLDVEKGDITPLEVLAYASVDREAFLRLNKPEKIAAMTAGLEKLIPELYAQGKIDGVMSVGGGQNGAMAAPAMKALPFGVPKVLSSALACGSREMEQFVGEKDIFVVPTVADIAGLNPITKTLIRSVCAAVTGLVQYGEIYHQTGDHKIIAATMLGETTKGTMEALRLITEGTDYEQVVFHANGVGGRCMEALIEEGQINAVLDYTLHEIVCELFGGYCAGARNRLLKSLEYGIPTLVVPGGLDMNDYYNESTGAWLPKDFKERKSVLHNANIWHSKITREEAEELVKVVCERLGTAVKPVTLVVPTKGCCQTTAVGGPIYDPEIDELMVRAFKEQVPPNVKLVVAESGINDPEFAAVVAEEFKLLLKEYGWN
ncbi:MAG: Tm-1-like ATP-binding domain-containing protein [Solobacterium sp.]|nr:Tm-1-like ATP-binding domain-containing protein [Solobacterium sp.]MBQ1447610.1 Tm-1-like ATP-binding domain-containing protein [Solobacterium sp.]MBQ2688800.1 Tm-1-like ATP-binding domain-containing protein [Solobacterium sp.]MBQ6591393.1 Tm-1-like ATP-binding domain-containing protein [Solobacterium sp.]MBR0478754.1 Tm-1-like ATP-binding domain-containing protein [Solobacterium sp.]